MSPVQINCCVCGHAVDEIIIEKDVCRMETVIIVRCHGQHETMRISDYDLMLCQKQIQGQTGKAFTTNKLETRP